MLFCGIVLGPYVLDLIDPTILNISAELRQIALIIILIKAGLSLNIADLKRVGRPAALMAFLPACFEILAYVLIAPIILGISNKDALLMGAVLAAVSPAIVVPRMVKLIENNYGTKKSIPQMILAGASCDDVFVMVLFTSFLAIAGGSESANLRTEDIFYAMLSAKSAELYKKIGFFSDGSRQLSFFENETPELTDIQKCLTGEL